MNETALTNEQPGDEAGRVLNTPIMAGVADPTPTLLHRTVSTLTQTSGHSHTMYITQAKNPL